MESIESFQNAQARHLPIILMLDVSGSMSGSKIDILNQAVKEMIDSFSGFKNPTIQLDVAIITFGGNVNLHQDILPAYQISWSNMSANGGTPMGGALTMAKDLIENKDKITSNSYRPVAILVSDGAPTDDWVSPMDNFINNGRTSKVQRMSMGIGSDSSSMRDTLVRFSGEANYYSASDSKNIIEFFKFVTMSVVKGASSVNPNSISDWINIQTEIDNLNEDYVEEDDF